MRASHFKFATLFVMISIIGLQGCTSSTLSHATESQHLPGDLLLELPHHSQLEETRGEGWNPRTTCGPTALLIVLHGLGLEDELTPVIEQAQRIPSQRGGYDPDCRDEGNPVCTSPAALAEIATEVYGLTVESRDGWTVEEVLQALSLGRPVITDVNLDLNPRRGGHFVVIIGISSRNGDLTVHYHDPYRGANRRAPWSVFERSWKGPIDIDDPLQPEGHRTWGMTAWLDDR